MVIDIDYLYIYIRPQMVIDIEGVCRGRCLKSAMRKESEVASKSARTSLFTPFHPFYPFYPFYPILPTPTPRPTSVSSNQNRLVHDTR